MVVTSPWFARAISGVFLYMEDKIWRAEKFISRECDFVPLSALLLINLVRGIYRTIKAYLVLQIISVEQSIMFSRDTY